LTNDTNKKRVTYFDCLAGRAPVPHDPFASSVFSLMMVGGMVSMMVTINGVQHAGTAFFPALLWMYPVIACIALAVRLLFVNRIIGWVIPNLIIPNFKGALRGIMITLANVVLMAPTMGSLVTLLLVGPEGFISNIVIAVPFSMCAAFLVNTFIVGPAAKMFMNNSFGVGFTKKLYDVAERLYLPSTVFFSF
jgi:hypothetical protein